MVFSVLIFKLYCLTVFYHILVCRYSIIRGCCHWHSDQRFSVSELIRTLQNGEKSANGRTVLRVPEPLDFEKYLREAGYGEAYNYAVLWLAGTNIIQDYIGAVVLLEDCYKNEEWMKEKKLLAEKCTLLIFVWTVGTVKPLFLKSNIWIVNISFSVD